jgi:hypothetical protein
LLNLFSGIVASYRYNIDPVYSFITVCCDRACHAHFKSVLHIITLRSFIGFKLIEG